MQRTLQKTATSSKRTLEMGRRATHHPEAAEVPGQIDTRSCAAEKEIVSPDSGDTGSATALLHGVGLVNLEGKSVDEVAAILRNIPKLLKDSNADSLLRAAVREEAVTRLKKANVASSPTILVNSALKDSPEEEDRQGQALALDDPVPWPEPVDGDGLLVELAGVLKRYVVLPTGGATATSLWSLYTYVHDASPISPYLGIVSPEKRCGKTTLLTVLGQQCLRPVPASNISPAALFRSVEEFRPTLIIDEAETFLHEKEELRGILNSGHHKSNAYVIRTVGDGHEPRIFSTWCPKALALIGRLPETLEDRSIVIRMRRRGPEEHVERFRLDRLDLEELRRKCARWGADHLEELRKADPEISDGLSDRAADNWRPLLAIADVAGGEWPARAREAAEILSGSNRDGNGDGSARIKLLEDLSELFESGEKLSSEEIVEALAQKEDRPWPEWNRGQPISHRGLAKLLEPFEVRPKQLWLDDRDQHKKKKRGYEKADFKDAWKRYLDPPSLDPSSTSGRSGKSDGAQRVTSDGEAVGDQSSTGREIPVNSCSTTALPVLPDAPPPWHLLRHAASRSKGPLRVLKTARNCMRYAATWTGIFAIASSTKRLTTG